MLEPNDAKTELTSLLRLLKRFLRTLYVDVGDKSTGVGGGVTRGSGAAIRFTPNDADTETPRPASRRHNCTLKSYMLHRGGTLGREEDLGHNSGHLRL